MKSNFIVLTTKPQKNTIRREFTNKPELRHENILNGLSADTQIIYPEMTLTLDLLKELGIHNDKMLNFLKEAYDSYLKVPDTNYDFVNTGIVPYVIYRGCADDEKIKQLLEKMEYWRQVGIWCNDAITPIFATTFVDALISARRVYNYILLYTKLYKSKQNYII